METTLRKGTVCFITQEQKVLLILIEYSPENRKWTGIGGMLEEGETLEENVLREVEEESYLHLDKSDLKKVAEINSSTFQLNVFLTDKWTGELKAKEPSLKEFKWFAINRLPFSDMHDNNAKWLPQVLVGKLVKVIDNGVIEVTSFD